MDDELVTLAWDSAFFGFGVGRCDSRDTSADGIARILAEAAARGLRLVYWVVPPEAPADALAAAGVLLVDRKVTYVAASGQRQAHPAVTATTTPSDHLLSLALQSGQYSRFRVDPRMPAGSFERMYAAWLDRSLAGELAREVLVFGEAGKDADGFLALGMKKGRADISLLGVDRASRGRGVGTALVDAAVARAHAWGLANVQVVTQQDNTPACSLYEKCGFTVEAVEHVHHAWL